MMYRYKDQYGMLRETSPAWHPLQNDGTGDSLGRTAEGWVLYEDTDFLTGIIRCYRGNKKMAFIRHPDSTRTDQSRDHVVMVVVALILTGEDKLLQMFLPSLKGWRISPYHTWRGAWLWLRAATGSKGFKRAYFAFNIPLLWITIRSSMLLYRLAKFGDPKDGRPNGPFRHTPVENLTRFQRIARKLIVPTYVLTKLGWQLSVVPGRGAEMMKRIVRPYVERTNYCLRLMMGDHVPYNLIKNYKPMKGCRWNMRMDLTADSDLNILDTAGEDYLMDKDMMYYFYENFKKKEQRKNIEKVMRLDEESKLY